MPHYALFGGCLAAPLPLAGLQPTDRAPDWRLTVLPDEAALAPAEGVRPLGRVVTGTCVTTLDRTADGFRFRHSCTGTFDVSADGATLRFAPAAGARDEGMPLDLCNRAVPIALHATGALCLHGSAVALDGTAVAFLADSGTGKSTLAAALVAAGSQLLSDDVVAVAGIDDDTDAPRVLPAVHQLRLRDDSAAHALGRPTDGAPAASTADGKQVITALADAQLRRAPAPLAALYLLEQAPADAPEAVQVIPLDPTPGALALLRHGKLASLLGGPELPTLLDRAAALARHVPVCRLLVARDLARLPDVVAALTARHGAPDVLVAR